MIMKVITFIIVSLLLFGNLKAQSVQDCSQSEYVCGQNGTSFGLNTNSSPTGLPSGLNVSNPSTNPSGQNSGCLFSNGTYPNWFQITIGTSGNLEFLIGQAGGSGFYDWALWQINTADPTLSCNQIFNNQLAPVACNWNASSTGFTGMWNNGVPPGGNAGNFQQSIPVLAGQTFVLLFSNYSGGSGMTQLSFPSHPGSAQVACSPNTPDQTICLGASAIVNLSASGNILSANWLVTNGVSNTSGITNVSVTPTVTTQYIVELNVDGTIVNDTFNITVVPPPSPNAGPDQTVCLGSPITLAGNAPPAGTTGLWTPIVPPGMTPPATASFSPNFSSPTPTVTVNQPGTYKFVWRHQNTLCGAVRDTVTVVVSQMNPVGSATTPSCQGASDAVITLTEPTAIEYSFDGGVTWITTNSFGGFSAGTHNVCVKNALGCTKCINVTVTDPAPVILSLSNDTIVCQNGIATLSASATGGTSYSFIWDHTSSIAGTQQVSPIATGYYPVYAQNEFGCNSQPDSILVTVRAPITGSLTPLDQFVCPGYPGTIQTQNVTGGIGAPYNFVWSTGATGTGNNHSITESPLVPTIYTVTITDACESTPLVISTSIQTYALPVPQFVVDKPEQCEPAVFGITNTTDPNLSASCSWFFSDGQEFLNTDQVTTIPMFAGAYDFQMVVVSPNGCIDSITFLHALDVKAQPIADFKWSPDPILMFNTEVLFSNYSTGADFYQWYFPGASPSTGNQENVSVMYPDGVAESYQVTLIATSSLGCDDTITKTVVVNPEVLLYAPNTFTPDGDEFNQSWRVFMEGIDLTNFELLVFNRWGELVFESHDLNHEWDGTYHGEILPQGSYIWTIRTKDLLTDKKYEYNGSVTILR